MKFVFLKILLCIFVTKVTFGQSKKEQISVLENKIDSLNILLDYERKINSMTLNVLMDSLKQYKISNLDFINKIGHLLSNLENCIIDKNIINDSVVVLNNKITYLRDSLENKNHINSRKNILLSLFIGEHYLNSIGGYRAWGGTQIAIEKERGGWKDYTNKCCSPEDGLRYFVRDEIEFKEQQLLGSMKVVVENDLSVHLESNRRRYLSVPFKEDKMVFRISNPTVLESLKEIKKEINSNTNFVESELYLFATDEVSDIRDDYTDFESADFLMLSCSNKGFCLEVGFYGLMNRTYYFFR
jgi:hypothetical protein